MGENKLAKGIIVGALVGAAISLLDRKTREDTIQQMRECSKKIWDFSKNPAVLIENISEKTAALRNKIEEVSEDVNFIIEKVNDMKESSEKLLRMNGDGNEEEDNKQ